MRDINSISRWEMPWSQTGATQYHALFGLPDKGRAIKWLVVCLLGPRAFRPPKRFNLEATQPKACMFNTELLKRIKTPENKLYRVG